MFQENDEKRHVFAIFVVGKTGEVTETSFVLTAPDGSKHMVRLRGGTASPAPGTLVAVSIDPNTQIAKAIAPIR